MPFVAIIIGAILIITAFNETHGDLAKNLEQDIPGYFKWGIAITVVLGLGFIPGMKIPSRWLIALVALVIVLTQYQNIIDGFKTFTQTDTASGTGNIDPTAAYVSSGGQTGIPTQTQIAGESGAQASQGGPGSTGPASSSTLAMAQRALAQSPLNPGSYTGLISGFGGGL